MGEKRGKRLQALFLHKCAEERYSIRTDIIGVLIYRCLPEHMAKTYRFGNRRIWGCQSLVLFGAFDTFFFCLGCLLPVVMLETE